MNISLKEAKETIFWLKLLKEWFNEDTSLLEKECEEIIKILVTIIKNTKINMKK
jgi:four helix bundle protein